MGNNIGKNIKLLDYAKQSATNALKLLQNEQFKKQQKRLASPKKLQRIQLRIIQRLIQKQ